MVGCRLEAGAPREGKDRASLLGLAFGARSQELLERGSLVSREGGAAFLDLLLARGETRLERLAGLLRLGVGGRYELEALGLDANLGSGRYGPGYSRTLHLRKIG